MAAEDSCVYARDLTKITWTTGRLYTRRRSGNGDTREPGQECLTVARDQFSRRRRRPTDDAARTGFGERH